MYYEWSWNPQVCLIRQGWVLIRGGAATGFQLHSKICCSGLSVAAVSPVLSFLGCWLCFSGWSLLACFGFGCLHPPTDGFCYRCCWFVGDCFADRLGLRYAYVFHFSILQPQVQLGFDCFRVFRCGKTCCVLGCSVYIWCLLFSLFFFVYSACCLCFLYNSSRINLADSKKKKGA